VVSVVHYVETPLSVSCRMTHVNQKHNTLYGRDVAMSLALSFGSKINERWRQISKTNTLMVPPCIRSYLVLYYYNWLRNRCFGFVDCVLWPWTMQSFCFQPRVGFRLPDSRQSAQLQFTLMPPPPIPATPQTHSHPSQHDTAGLSN
jgi:hypothetical protein